MTPNDTLFKYQYALSNTGQDIGQVPGSPQGKPSADIKAPQAWEETTGMRASSSPSSTPGWTSTIPT